MCRLGFSAIAIAVSVLASTSRPLRRVVSVGSLAVGSAALALSPTAQGKVTHLQLKGEPKSWSHSGDIDYIEIRGVAHGTLDPKLTANKRIQDIEHAVGADGLVHYSTDVVIRKPEDALNRSGLVTLVFPNRGGHGDGRFLKWMMNNQPAHGGDTMVIAGWQADLAADGKTTRATVPVARQADGAPITGRISREISVRGPQDTSKALARTRPLHTAPAPVSLDTTNAKLTYVDAAGASSAVLASNWAFARVDANNPFPGKPDPSQLAVRGGLKPGTYRVEYEAKDPLVHGVGLAAVRDIAAFLKNAKDDDMGNPNPVSGINAIIGYGYSQAGRAAKTFLLAGFNETETGGRALDAVALQHAVLYGDANRRWAQPTINPVQGVDPMSPLKSKPFTWTATRDPVTARREGVLDACLASNTCPERIMVTTTPSEMFQGGGSLRWTVRKSSGREDFTGEDARVHQYYLAGAPHFFHPKYKNAPDCSADLNLMRTVIAHSRALFEALRQNMLIGKEMPPSAFPTIADGSLVLPQDVAFQGVPGLEFDPTRVNSFAAYNYGKGFNIARQTGVIDEVTPAATANRYTVHLPQVGSDGNERGGIRAPEIAVPLATYTGWQPSANDGNKLCGIWGTSVPLAANAAARKDGDKRPTLADLYRDHSDYFAKYKVEVEKQTATGLILAQDAEAMITRAQYATKAFESAMPTK